MHDGMQYDPIQGQVLEVSASACWLFTVGLRLKLVFASLGVKLQITFLPARQFLCHVQRDSLYIDTDTFL